VQIEIHPQPSEDERMAIEQALASIAGSEPAASAWWAEGVRQNALDETAPPEQGRLNWPGFYESSSS
jgi:hypothetical protein